MWDKICMLKFSVSVYQDRQLVDYWPKGTAVKVTQVFSNGDCGISRDLQANSDVSCVRVRPNYLLVC